MSVNRHCAAGSGKSSNSNPKGHHMEISVSSQLYIQLAHRGSRSTQPRFQVTLAVH